MTNAKNINNKKSIPKPKWQNFGHWIRKKWYSKNYIRSKDQKKERKRPT